MIKAQKTTYLHSPKNVDELCNRNVVVAAAGVENHDQYYSCNYCIGGNKEYVTATAGRWKVSLVQDHGNVAVNGVAACNVKDGTAVGAYQR